MNLRKVGINMENNRYGLYYNHKTIGDVLLIEFKPNEYPTRVEKHDNVVALYDNDDLVGINVFNISFAAWASPSEKAVSAWKFSVLPLRAKLVPVF